MAYSMSRRRFLKQSLAVTIGAPAVAAAGRVLGANDAVRVAVAGVNGRGSDHVAELLGVPGVEVVCLVDPDTRTFAKPSRTITDKGRPAPKTFQDVRRALEDKDIDALTIATPNHWHSLMAIWGCQAGKDVYVEKPMSHNVREGRVLVETARKTGRIVQHGTQSRSSTLGALIAELARRGTYGKLRISRGLCYKPRGSIGVKPAKAPPKEVDFDLWLGPAQEVPFHENLVHYNWHWFWSFGCGDIGNQGVHEMDVARWSIAGATLPKSVICLGGRFGYSDQGETPNTQVAVFDYGETKLVFEVRGLNTEAYQGEKVGNTFHFDEGVVAGWKFFPKGGANPEKLPDIKIQRGPGKDHFANFIAAVRSRKTEDLNAPIIEGHYSSALCHLANISWRLGTDAPFGSPAKALEGEPELAEALDRMGHHLEDMNGVKLAGLNFRLGKKLQVDAATETIVGQPEALLTRTYRAPFVVPVSA